MAKKYRAFLFALVACLFATQAWAQESRETVPEIFKASSVAYLHFRDQIAKTNAGKTELESFLSDIENYQIVTYSQANIYAVEFVPKMYQGGRLRGGGASYEIDATTMRILKFSPTR